MRLTCHLFSLICAVVSVPASALPDARGLHPARWWEPVPADQKASWEILPQEAKPGEVILSKRGELGLLSNFAATAFTLDGVRYASIEGFWQMMLYPDGPDDPRRQGGPWPHERTEVAAMTGFAAKAAGTQAKEILQKLGIDWITYRGHRLYPRGKDQTAHLLLIRRAMSAKLEQNHRVQEILLATGDLVLRPDHLQAPDRTPAHDYHLIWMDLRAAFLNEERRRVDTALQHWLPEHRARITAVVLASLAEPDRVAIFDADGTLWHADLPREFLEFQIERRHLLHFDYGTNAAAAVERLYGTCQSEVAICIAQAAYLHVGLPLQTLEAHMSAFFTGFGARVFKGQQELIYYLRERGFSVYVVSGGPKWLTEGAVQRYFALPPESVIGVRTKIVDGVVSTEVIPPVPFREGKLKAISQLIGKDIQIAAGNTGSDVPMLELAQRLQIAIHSFGPQTPGFHYKAEQDLLKEAQRRGWLIRGF